MRHYSEDELTLYYYGEGRRREAIERHIDECAACASLYRDIAGTLALVAAPESPGRGEHYGGEVWQRIRTGLDDQHLAGFSRFSWFSGFSVAAAAAVVLVGVFLGGRAWQRSQAAPSTTVAAVHPENPEDHENPENRILLSSVADHFDRSARVLSDIMNARGHNDISAEQRWAEDLLDASRLYRQDALDAGEQSVASVLDELERSLIEIVHSPSRASAADLEQIRRRIDAAELLFKVRVMSDELRQRELPPADAAPRTMSTRKVSQTS